MSKLVCNCGGVISNVHYPSPTEGSIMKEQEEERCVDGICADLVAFFQAVGSGDRDGWIRGYFLNQYPTSLSDESVVSDIITRGLQGTLLRVCECQNCGRLHLQRRSGENQYLSFAPDGTKYQAVLKSRNDEKA